MPKHLRLFFLFVPPALLGLLNVSHPIIAVHGAGEIRHHLPWWLILHGLNLLLFPLLGFAAYLLLGDVHNVAATVSRVAIAVYVPIYAAFDALAGIGTGTLVQHSLQLSPDQLTTADQIIESFWASATIYSIAVAGSIAWVIAMIAAAVALTVPERRRLVAVVGVIVFFLGGWARGNLFLAADGMSIRFAWWFLTIALALVMLAVCRPGVSAALLTLAGALFGAYHTPPTGPLGVACFLAAAAYVEMVGPRRESRESPESLDQLSRVTAESS